MKLLNGIALVASLYLFPLTFFGFIYHAFTASASLALIGFSVIASFYFAHQVTNHKD
jgi:hypothetical protein